MDASSWKQIVQREKPVKNWVKTLCGGKAVKPPCNLYTALMTRADYLLERLDGCSVDGFLHALLLVPLDGMLTSSS